MGKKKKHEQKHGSADRTGSRRADSHKEKAGTGTGLPPQVAGIAAAVSRHLASPEGRHLLATGLTMAAAAASAALTRPAAQAAHRTPEPPVPPRPPEPPVAPESVDVPPPPPAPPPTPPEPSQGTSKAPDPQVIATVIGDMADQLFAKLFTHRKN